MPKKGGKTMDLNFETADLLKEDAKKSDVVADESKPQEKTDSVENKPAESKKDESRIVPDSQKTNETAQKDTVVEPPAKPIEGGAKVMTQSVDPQGMFDYANREQHVVQEGENLFDVAQKYNVALEQLRYFNHISKKNTRIRVGRTLFIPRESIDVPVGE